MLKIENLTLTSIKDMRVLIDNFSFTLSPGTRAAIIGEEGNGKSTLLKAIYNPQLVEGYCDVSGKVDPGGETIGYLAQELTAQQKSESVFSFMSALPSFYESSPRELADISHKLGLDCDVFYSDQIIGTMSGGEKVKLQLAALLIEKPGILLLDEPSNDIDIETLEWLESFILNSDVPIMFVSHDETLISNTANTIIHIELVRRKTVARCSVSALPYREYIVRRSEMLADTERIARGELADYNKKMERWRKIYDKVERAQENISRQDPGGGRLLKKKMHNVLSMGKRFEREKENMTQIPDTEDAIMLFFDQNITFPAGKIALSLTVPELKIGERVLSRDITLEVRGGEHICIIGRNGAGKTTLLRIIADMLLKRSDIKAAYMPQDYSELLGDTRTPIEFLAPSGRKDDITRAQSFLGCTKYTADEMSHTVSELSGGQKAKLLFLKMILDGANVLILDEPTRNFSPLSAPVIRNVLREYGGAVISVSHDRLFIADNADSVYKLDENGLTLIDEE